MIQFKNVCYFYEKKSMFFDFVINKGEIITILGPSGAGKSTLLHLIAGFIYAESGKIYLNSYDETQTSASKRPVSMLFQDNNIFSHLTVEQNLALGLSPSLKLTQDQHGQLQKIVDRIGLTDLLSFYPSQLSGGQKQRIAIGRCLLQHRPILLLDEPFSSLDPKLKKEMFTLLYEVQKEYDLTILMVTHQLEDVQNDHQRCFVIIDGKIQFDDEFSKLKRNADIAQYLGLLES